MGTALKNIISKAAQGRRLDADEGLALFRKAVLLTDGKSRNGMGPLSRKGDRLVYSSNKRNGRDTDLYLLDLQTGASEMILEAKGEFWSASDWSPDDSKLALLRTEVREELATFYPEFARQLEAFAAAVGARGAPEPRGAREGHEPREPHMMREHGKLLCLAWTFRLGRCESNTICLCNMWLL